MAPKTYETFDLVSTRTGSSVKYKMETKNVDVIIEDNAMKFDDNINSYCFTD